MNLEDFNRMNHHLGAAFVATSRERRIAHLRSLIRNAQDCYDYELHQLESLNVVHADPALTAAHGEPVV